MKRADASSNFEVANNPLSPRWKRCPYKGYEHVEVSSNGDACNNRNGKGTMLAKGKPNADVKRMYVTLPANPETGVKTWQIPIDRLVYDTFNGKGILPPFVKVVHKNGNLDDNRFDNLVIPPGVMPVSVPTIVNLPTIRPNETEKPQMNPLPVNSNGDARQAEMARRYQARLDELALQLMDCENWQSASDITRIGIMESEWLYLLFEVLKPEETVKVVMALIDLLKNQEGK